MRLVGQLSLGCHRDALLVHLIPRAAKMAGRCVGLIPSRRPRTRLESGPPETCGTTPNCQYLRRNVTSLFGVPRDLETAQRIETP
jgi:hypothetical protein